MKHKLFAVVLVVCLAAAGPAESTGEAALYGMMGTLPDRKAAKALALQYLNNLYRLKE